MKKEVELLTLAKERNPHYNREQELAWMCGYKAALDAQPALAPSDCNEESEIKEELRKYGLSDQQVNYVFGFILSNWLWVPRKPKLGSRSVEVEKIKQVICEFINHRKVYDQADVDDLATAINAKLDGRG